jgi:4-phytase/acid phosphatase
MKRMKYSSRSVLCAFALVLCVGSPATASDTPPDVRLVVVMTRHGVRSPTKPAELAPYAARAWPAWEVPPGNLTPHGAALMRDFGAYYGRRYGFAKSARGACPAAGSVFVWADTDQRTLATGQALVDGFAPGCGIAVNHAGGSTDTLFDPPLANIDAGSSQASVTGAVGGDPNTISQAYARQFTELNAILGCGGAGAACRATGTVPTVAAAKGDGGLFELTGGLDLAAGAAGNLYLEYVDGHAKPGWGRLDRATLIDLLKLRTIKAHLTKGAWYNARAHSSNVLAHITATLEQAASGKALPLTRAPLTSRAVFLVGHDTQMWEIAGLLRLSWLAPEAVIGDAPPGGALIFELHNPHPPATEPFVRLLFASQTMDDMRAGIGSRPNAVPVYVPGCPAIDCPIETFTSIVNASVDPQRVVAW